MNRGPSAIPSLRLPALLARSAMVAGALIAALMLVATGCGSSGMEEQVGSATQEAATPRGSATSATTAAGAASSTTPTPSTTATTTTAAPTTSTSTTSTSTTSTSTTSISTSTTEAVPTTVPVDPAADPSELIRAVGDGPVAGDGPLHTYSVDVERATGFAPEVEAAIIESVLSHPRSWIGESNLSFQRVAGAADLAIILATPPRVDAMCAPLRTNGYFSCRRSNRVILNSVRWTSATDSWATSLREYRQYLVNHEVGHYLGLGHVGCPAAGAPAPVMMQQTKGIGSCSPNSWPVVG